MSELRQDRVTGAWTIVAPDRSGRPHRDPACDAGADRNQRFDPSCPFCPGNEEQLPGIISQLPHDEPPGWRTRVVPNKYPVLAPTVGSPSAALAVPGFGYHEVVIETHRHDGDLAGMAAADVAAVVHTYQNRYRELAARSGVASVLVFRNHGSRGGASLVHPHSQIIAMDRIAPRLAAAMAWALTCYTETSRCPTCSALDLELRDGTRVVEATDSFVVLVPFAAASPCELCVVPRRHAASFARADGAELAEFGRLLQRSLFRLNAVLGDPPYNFAIESGPEDETCTTYCHWRLRIVPQVVVTGGFELGAGLSINPSRPEDDARALRAATEESAT